MMSCFTYEEFHPNAKWDIEQAIDYFFRMNIEDGKCTILICQGRALPDFNAGNSLLRF
jgi:hypothetical protein